jgi:S-adenosylmethionine:tRNA ribosyltransferase-isomerase
MLVDEFDFVLPKDLIADVPVYPRDKSRLLQVKNLEDKFMDDFPSLLQAGDVLVFNDTKVIPARISGTKGTAKVEVTLHMEIANGIWKAFAKPARKLKLNDKFFVADDFSAVVIDKKDAEVILNFSINTDEF